MWFRSCYLIFFLGLCNALVHSQTQAPASSCLNSYSLATHSSDPGNIANGMHAVVIRWEASNTCHVGEVEVKNKQVVGLQYINDEGLLQVLNLPLQTLQFKNALSTVRLTDGSRLSLLFTEANNP